MRGFLFDDVQVEVAPRASQFGGSWQGAPRDGLPTAWDPETLRFFYQHMPTPCHFLDIGASTGSYCLLCALKPDITCIAFEPNPYACDMLCANVVLNDLDDGHVIIMPYALWDCDGVGMLALPDTAAMGLACLAETPTRFTPASRISVVLRRLDGLIRGGVNMIKVDVEGAELFVLRGAQETLMHDHPALLLEYDERNVAAFGYERKEIVDFLKEFGYMQFERLGPDGRDLWAT